MKELRAKVPEHRQVFLVKQKDLVASIKTETAEVRQLLDLIVEDPDL